MGFALLWAAKVAARRRLENSPPPKENLVNPRKAKTLETIVFSYIKYKVMRYNKNNKIASLNNLNVFPEKVIC